MSLYTNQIIEDDQIRNSGQNFVNQEIIADLTDIEEASEAYISEVPQAFQTEKDAIFLSKKKNKKVINEQTRLELESETHNPLNENYNNTNNLLLKSPNKSFRKDEDKHVNIMEVIDLKIEEGFRKTHSMIENLSEEVKNIGTDMRKTRCNKIIKTILSLMLFICLFILSLVLTNVTTFAIGASILFSMFLYVMEIRFNYLNNLKDSKH